MLRRDFIKQAILGGVVAVWPVKPSDGKHPLFDYLRGEVVRNVTIDKDGKTVVWLSNNKSITTGNVQINEPLNIGD